jgi:hypothetical protein
MNFDELDEFLSDASFSDETDENFKEENAIVVASIDWAPMPEAVSWQDPNFAKEIIARLRGVTEESFGKEVTLWQQSISMLPYYDEIAIRNEIRQWDMSIPNRGFDFQDFALAYSLQVQYRNRLTEMISIVHAHYEMISQAHKTLKEMAVKLATGTAVDKNGTATFTVHPILFPATHSKRLLDYLNNVLKNIDFSASQMDRLLREHQALSRINQTSNVEGSSAMYSRENFTQNQYNKDSVQVKTRNNRIS